MRGYKINRVESLDDEMKRHQIDCARTNQKVINWLQIHTYAILFVAVIATPHSPII